MDVDSFSKLILPKRTNVFFEKECVAAIIIVVFYDEKYLFLTLISGNLFLEKQYVSFGFANW